MVQVRNMATDNKRNSPRFDSLNLLAYSVFDENDALIRQGMGRTLNVSSTGILLETHVQVPSEHKIALTLGLEDNLVEIKGKAVYSRAGQEDMYETGIEFMECSENQQAILTAFIEVFEESQQ
jgi:hypothetical protein